MNVCAVIVTYNRLNCLRKNIKCILEQTIKIYKIIIINNNSSDGTKEYLENVSKDYDNLIIKNLNSNIGGAGGFAIGIEEAMNIKNSDYIWGMDDDAYPEKDALEKLLCKADKKKCLWSNCNNDKDFINEIKEVKSWMFVGFFIPINIVKEIGIPRKDFFIYFDDFEYARRIIKKKYKIYKIRDSVINHKDTMNENKLSKKILNKEIKFFIMPDWKIYYLVRNQILMYKWYELPRIKVIFWILPKFLFKILIFNRKQTKVFIKGYLHGIIGKSGIIMKP